MKSAGGGKRSYAPVLIKEFRGPQGSRAA